MISSTTAPSMTGTTASDYQNAYLRLQQSALFAAQRQQHMAKTMNLLDNDTVNDLSIVKQRQSPTTTDPSPGLLDTTPPSDMDGKTSAASNNTSPRSKRKQAQPQQISSVDEPLCKTSRLTSDDANEEELLEMNASVKNEEDTGELTDDEPTVATTTTPSVPQPMSMDFDRMQQAMRLQRQYLEMMARQPQQAHVHGANGKQVKAFGDTLRTQLVNNMQGVLDRAFHEFVRELETKMAAQMKQSPQQPLLPAFLQQQQYRMPGIPFNPLYANFNGASHSIFPSSTIGQYLNNANNQHHPTTTTAVDLAQLPRKKRSKVTDSSQRPGKLSRGDSCSSTPQAPSMVFAHSPSVNGSPMMMDNDQVSSTLTPIHLRKAKLMFFFVRYPSSAMLKGFFPDIRFNKNNTAQLVKWFSNFREFYYIQMEKFARAALTEGVNDAAQLVITEESELYKALNQHYNRQNRVLVGQQFFEMPPTFPFVVETTLREFFTSIQSGKDMDPSWKKQIYKVIARLDEPIPAHFQSCTFVDQIE